MHIKQQQNTEFFSTFCQMEQMRSVPRIEPSCLSEQLSYFIKLSKPDRIAWTSKSSLLNSVSSLLSKKNKFLILNNFKEFSTTEQFMKLLNSIIEEDILDIKWIFRSVENQELVVEVECFSAIDRPTFLQNQEISRFLQANNIVKRLLSSFYIYSNSYYLLFVSN